MIRFTALTLCCALALGACSPHQSGSSATDNTTITINTARGQAKVPLMPQQVAVFDLSALDTLNKLGVKVGAITEKPRVEYLAKLSQSTQAVGTLFEPDYEKLNIYKPQLIITGPRTVKAFDQLAKLAPTVEMTVDNAHMLNSAKERIDTYAQIFNKQAEAENLKNEIDRAFEEAKVSAKGKGTGLVLIVSGGKLSAHGPSSRLGGWLHHDIGLPPVDNSINAGAHGQPVSFEYIKQHNPDWLFVLDRSAAIGEKSEAAKNVLDNPLVASTNAWKKGQVVYLPPESYLASGGAQELLNVTALARDAFKKAK